MDKQVKHTAKAKAKKTVKKKLAKAGLGKGSAGRSFLAAMSPYLASLADPVNNFGVKIPDEVTTPSFVIHVRMSFQSGATTTGGGNNGVGFYRLLGATVVAASTTNCILGGGATADAIVNATAANPWATEINAVACAHRLVSAELVASFQGATQTDGGRMMCVFYLPNNGFVNPPVSIANDILATPLRSSFALKVGFGQVRYVPTDPIARSYSKTSTTQTASNDIRVNSATYGAYAIYCDGMTAGQLVEFTSYENYECLPNNGTVNLAQPTVSKSDPLEMAMVSNIVAEHPTLTIGQNPQARERAAAEVNVPLTVTPAKSGESGFLDNVLNAISKTIPVAEQAVKFAGPLLAGLL